MKDHIFLSFILIAVILFSVALGGTILIMNLTKSKDVQIPNLVKTASGVRLTEQQAVEIYNSTEFKKKNDLKIEYVEDETINGETVEPGQVVKQNPNYVENRKIKVKDQITIYVRKEREAKTLKMIDLTGKTTEEAEKLLADLGYVGKITYEDENSDSLKTGLIIRQTIQSGIEFKDNADLTLTISKGSDKVDVPNALGKTEEEAKKLIGDAGFTVKVEYTENNDKSDGIVLKQSNTDKAKTDEVITITVNKVQKTKSVAVTIDLSKYVQVAKAPTNTVDNTTNSTTTDTPGVTTAEVKLKVGDDVYGGEKYNVTTKPTIMIYGRGNMKVALIIDGITKITKDIDFNKDTTLAFP